MTPEDQDVIATLQDSIIYDDPLYQRGAASRDAEIHRLQMALADAEALEIGTAERCDQLRAELVNALAACKAKDEALDQLLDDMGDDGHCVCPAAKQLAIEALAIKPDDAALIAWLGEPECFYDGNKFYTDERSALLCMADMVNLRALYHPKGLK
jgi:hypothetical protein